MPELVIPSEIPWKDIKGELLESFVYWLLDEMGAKDLEWRRGGTSATSADGGRDLEASFYVPSPDGEMVKQRWWIQVKGRTGTVSQRSVKDFITTVRSESEIDVVVVATNTQFSNPTRDWIKQCLKLNPRPSIRLWDREALERQAVKHPSVIVRISPNALSPQGSLEAMTSRFWNNLYFPNRKELERLWESRKTLAYTAEALVALTAGEISNGDIAAQPWLRRLTGESLLATVVTTISNFVYLLARAERTGVDQNSIAKVAAHIILTGIAYLPKDTVDDLLLSPLSYRSKEIGRTPPKQLDELISSLLLESVRGSLRDPCSMDCTRIIRDGDNRTETIDLWERLRGNVKKANSKRSVEFVIEARSEACNAGLTLSEEQGCPLFTDRPKTALTQIQVYSEIVRNRLGMVGTKNSLASW